MGERRRYRLRSKAVELPLPQLVLVGVAAVVALAGVVLVINGQILGAALMGLSALIVSAVTIVASSGSQKR